MHNYDSAVFPSRPSHSAKCNMQMILATFLALSPLWCIPTKAQNMDDLAMVNTNGPAEKATIVAISPTMSSYSQITEEVLNSIGCVFSTSDSLQISVLTGMLKDSLVKHPNAIDLKQDWRMAIYFSFKGGDNTKYLFQRNFASSDEVKGIYVGISNAVSIPISASALQLNNIQTWLRNSLALTGGAGYDREKCGYLVTHHEPVQPQK